jgi:predicted nuclease with TOPRIM domain
MSEDKIKDVNKEAFKQAEKELLEIQVEKVKGFILETLKKMEVKKKEKEKIDEELRILKMDIEDLRNGRFDKIEERIEKSKVARGVSVNPFVISNSPVQQFANQILLGQAQCLNWNNATSGTYNADGKVYYL